MITKIHPHPCLDHLIDYYWIEKKGSYKTKVLPDGSLSIIFNIGGEIGITDTDGNENMYSADLIIGTQKKYFILEMKEDANVVGVKFKQGEAYHFLKKPMLQFTDKIVKLNDIFNTDTNSLCEVLVKAQNEDEIRKILNYFFFINVESLICDSKIVDSVIQKVNVSKSALLIKDLCESENISNKHLISLFNKKVDISPKLLYRINKFKKVIELLQDNTNINWSQIAYECHYYDQAHLINEFKNFSGVSPNEYLKNKKANGLYIEVV